MLYLYDTQIHKQTQLLDRTKKNKFKSTTIRQSVLVALVKGDLKRLEGDRVVYQKNLDELNRRLTNEEIEATQIVGQVRNESPEIGEEVEISTQALTQSY